MLLMTFHVFRIELFFIIPLFPFPLLCQLGTEVGRDKAVDLLESPFRCKVVVFHIARHDVRGKGEHGFKHLMHEHIQIRLGAEKVCDALDQRVVVLLLPVVLVSVEVGEL